MKSRNNKSRLKPAMVVTGLNRGLYFRFLREMMFPLRQQEPPFYNLTFCT
ncbi:hypothetical protein ACMA1I_06425 [Pontibacter sp. 13R65]